MGSEYTNELKAEILDDVKKWSKECRSYSEYNDLLAADKENFEFITNTFANHMYTCHLLSPKQWTANALKDVLVNIFPEKLADEPAVYNSVEPVLFVFFGYLHEIGVIKNVKSLRARLKSASKTMKLSKSVILFDNQENYIDEEPFKGNIINAITTDPEGETESKANVRWKDLEDNSESIHLSQGMKEPTLEQWAALYEVAKNIRKLEPWKFLWDSNIITVMLPNYNEPLYCSTMGRAGECYGIAVYPGKAGLISYYRIAGSPDDEPPFISAFEQNCLLCYFGDREDVEPKDRKIMKKLGIHFRGSNEWIYFRAVKPGYFPWFINYEQAEILIGALQNMVMAAIHYRSNKLAVDFDGDETILRFYSDETKLWLNSASKMPPMPVVDEKLIIDDDILIARIKKQKRNPHVLEFETTYMPMPIQEKRDKRPYLPRIVLLVDKESGVPVDQLFLDEGDETESAVIGMLVSYIEKCGRPHKIYVRDDRTGNLISDFCNKLKIKLIMNQGVPTIDYILMGFLAFM